MCHDVRSYPQCEIDICISCQEMQVSSSWKHRHGALGCEEHTWNTPPSAVRFEHHCSTGYVKTISSTCDEQHCAARTDMVQAGGRNYQLDGPCCRLDSHDTRLPRIVAGMSSQNRL